MMCSFKPTLPQVYDNICERKPSSRRSTWIIVTANADQGSPHPLLEEKTLMLRKCIMHSIIPRMEPLYLQVNIAAFIQLGNFMKFQAVEQVPPIYNSVFFQFYSHSVNTKENLKDPMPTLVQMNQYNLRYFPAPNPSQIYHIFYFKKILHLSHFARGSIDIHSEQAVVSAAQIGLG